MEASAEDQQKCKVRKIDSFFKLKKTSLELLSQLTAVDGRTFNQFTISKRLRRAFQADEYDLPRSHQQVKDLVIKYREKIIKLVHEEFIAIKQKMVDLHPWKHECSKGSKDG